MHTFLDNFQNGRKYSAHTTNHQGQLRREETIADQKSLYISALKINYLNLDNSVRNIEGERFPIKV